MWRHWLSVARPAADSAIEPFSNSRHVRFFNLLSTRVTSAAKGRSDTSSSASDTTWDGHVPARVLALRAKHGAAGLQRTLARAGETTHRTVGKSRVKAIVLAVLRPRQPRDVKVLDSGGRDAQKPTAHGADALAL